MLQEPHRLDAEEQQTWAALIGVLGRLPAVLDAQLQRDAGISHFEFQVLAGLSMAAERTMRMSELAVVAVGSLSRLSQVISRMEKRGWVRRTPDPTDGRYTLAVLTNDGWDKVVATAPAHVATLRRYVFEPLTRAQQKQLRGISQRILRAIGPDDAS